MLPESLVSQSTGTRERTEGSSFRSLLDKRKWLLSLSPIVMFVTFVRFKTFYTTKTTELSAREHLSRVTVKREL